MRLFFINSEDDVLMSMTKAKTMLTSWPVGVPKPISLELEGLILGFDGPYISQINIKNDDLNNQSRKVREKNQYLRAVLLLNQNFFDNLNSLIKRNRAPINNGFKADDRLEFGLGLNQTSYPSMRTESEIMMWADKIILGEQTRIDKGYPPVGLLLLQDITLYKSGLDQKMGELQPLKLKARESQRIVTSTKKEGMDIYHRIYEELEYFYRKLEESVRRENERQLGILFKEAKSELETVSGYISNDDMPLENAAITFVGIDIILHSKIDGSFQSKNIPVGIYTIKISCEGYIDKIIENFQVHANIDNELIEELELDFA